MKKIGIVGGVAWPSTMDYYRLICSGANAHFKALGTEPPYPAPPIAIESLVMAETRKLRGKPGSDEGWEAFDAVFRDAFKRLEASGCAFGLIASNTPHARLHAIKEGLSLPLISIFDETLKAAQETGAKIALVLGTSVTMRSANYPGILQSAGIEPNAPLPEDEIDAMQALIDHEFYEGASVTGTEALLDVCKRFVPEPDDTAILLACTELPLAFPDYRDSAIFSTRGFTFVNTTAAHAQAALLRSLS
ncbi:MAG: aspartate/glutamate racemase family protein [Hyphomicrobiales bacterium]